MIVQLPCGHIIDDAVMDTTCFQTAARPDGVHYPIGAGPYTFCKRCDLFRPCLCDKAAPDDRAA